MPTDWPKTSLDELDKVERHLNQGAAFPDWLGIRVFEPERGEDGEVVWHLGRNLPPKLTNILTIGIYEGHARLDCPGERVESPQTAFEKAFYPKQFASQESLRWLEREAKRRKIHIHHAMCGHGGERWVESAPVDGYNHATKTIFQYHGCHWHGCRKCFPHDRDKIVDRNNQTREDRYEASKKRTRYLKKAGYQVIETWGCEVGKIGAEPPRAETKSYPHAILYDFEA